MKKTEIWKLVQKSEEMVLYLHNFASLGVKNSEFFSLFCRHLHWKAPIDSYQIVYYSHLQRDSEKNLDDNTIGGIWDGQIQTQTQKTGWNVSSWTRCSWQPQPSSGSKTTHPVCGHAGSQPTIVCEESPWWTHDHQDLFAATKSGPQHYQLLPIPLLGDRCGYDPTAVHKPPGSLVWSGCGPDLTLSKGSLGVFLIFAPLSAKVG